ncbi:MAG TPA: hypothetical protein PLN41_03505 [Methanothrix sp.]|jgi:hypothetical protein|nr:hypothetical protein [Methanothrix sp.]
MGGEFCASLLKSGSEPQDEDRGGSMKICMQYAVFMIIMLLAALLLCSQNATASATDDEINRCELCNKTELEQILKQTELGQNDLEILNRCCIPVAELLEQDDPEMIDFYGEPHYILITHTTEPEVDTGDEFGIYLYIDGGGNITYSEIGVSIPHYIVENKTVKHSHRDYRTTNTLFCCYYNTSIQGPRFIIYPADSIYKRISNNKKLIGACDWPGGDINPMDIITFKIDKNAPAGDHDIVLAYIYTNSEKWYVQKEIVKLHVNYWYETKFYQIILTLVAILTISYLVHYIYKNYTRVQFLALVLTIIIYLILTYIY